MGVGLFRVGFSPIQKTVAVMNCFQWYWLFSYLNGLGGAGTMVTFGPVWAEAGTMINKAKMTAGVLKRAGV